MAEINFTVTQAVKNELNECAVAANFANVKQMTRAYWRETIRARRQKAIDAAVVKADISDVDVT